MSIDLNKLNGCEIHKIVNSVEAKVQLLQPIRG